MVDVHVRSHLDLPPLQVEGNAGGDREDSGPSAVVSVSRFLLSYESTNISASCRIHNGQASTP